MTEHNDFQITSCELMPISKTDGLVVWLNIHAVHITTPYTVDSSYETAGWETETEVEIEVGEVYNDEDGLTDLTEEQIINRSWWKELKQKAERYAEEY